MLTHIAKVPFKKAEVDFFTVNALKTVPLVSLRANEFLPLTVVGGLYRMFVIFCGVDLKMHSVTMSAFSKMSACC